LKKFEKAGELDPEVEVVKETEAIKLSLSW
jgi:hypothetical protein